MVDKEEIEWCKTVRENCSGPSGEVVTCSNAAEVDGYCIYCISDQLRDDYAKLKAENKRVVNIMNCRTIAWDKAKLDLAYAKAENKRLEADYSESLTVAHMQGAAASQDVIRKLRERQPRNEAAIAQLEARELRIKCANLEAENKRLRISDHKIVKLKAAIDTYKSGWYTPASVKSVMISLLDTVLEDDEIESEANND